MKKILSLIATLFILNGCAESIALLGPATTSGLSGGKISQSVASSAVSYGVKKKTGMSPSEHAVAFAEKHNPEKQKDTCISFIKKTNSEVCKIIKKQISSTKAKIVKNKKHDKSLRDKSLLLQSKIDKKSKIKYLD